MVTARSLGIGTDYARYLEGRAKLPERGDYYLGADGLPAEAPGRWVMLPETQRLLGIDADAGLVGEQFRRLVAGRHPVEDRFLRGVGVDRDGRVGRAGGIDVVFSAPKSVSVAWAVGGPQARAAIEAAQDAAVARAVAYLRERVPTARPRSGGGTRELVPAADVLAAAWRHTVTRGIDGEDGLADPQLHDHVVITGVLREDGAVNAVASRAITQGGRPRELGAVYRAELAAGLGAAGFSIQAGTGKEGRYFEIDGVGQGTVDAFSHRSREVDAAIAAFQAAYGRPPQRGELGGVKLAQRRQKVPTTRGELTARWQGTAAEHGRAGGDPSWRHRVEGRLAYDRAIVTGATVTATVLEQGAGEGTADELLARVGELKQSGSLLELADGRYTTREIRRAERLIHTTTQRLARPSPAVDVGDQARDHGRAVIGERIGASLSAEQEHALGVLTGAERIAVLIGPAGTGKGVVLEAAAQAERHAGRHPIGVALAGSTAQRLGEDPASALHDHTMTLDALLYRHRHGSQAVGQDTTITVDEAAMLDTRRTAALFDLAAHTGAKLVLVGDSRQLQSIQAGGMFDAIHDTAPSAELDDVRRARDQAERNAWKALRRHDPEPALAHYLARGQLHIANTRPEALEAACQRHHDLTATHPAKDVALVLDGSNHEIHRANARIQHLRHQRGELAADHVEHPDPDIHYALHTGDRVSFVAPHREDGQRRVENGTTGHILAADPDISGVMIGLDGSERQVAVFGADLDRLRLGYAHHVHRVQGATVEHTIAVTGGWQTNAQATYVLAPRARQTTHWHVNRDELGHDGTDTDRIHRLAHQMTHTHEHEPSIDTPLASDQPWIDPAPELHRLRPLPGHHARRPIDRTTPDPDELYPDPYSNDYLNHPPPLGPRPSAPPEPSIDLD